MPRSFGSSSKSWLAEDPRLVGGWPWFDHANPLLSIHHTSSRDVRLEQHDRTRVGPP